LSEGKDHREVLYRGRRGCEVGFYDPGAADRYGAAFEVPEDPLGGCTAILMATRDAIHVA
jgi:hypothetical protein